MSGGAGGLAGILDAGQWALQQDGSAAASRLLALEGLDLPRRRTPIYALRACRLLPELREESRPAVADALVVALALSDWSATTAFVPLRFEGRKRPIEVMIGVEPRGVTLCEEAKGRLPLPADRLDPVGRYAVMLLGQQGVRPRTKDTES